MLAMNASPNFINPKNQQQRPSHDEARGFKPTIVFPDEKNSSPKNKKNEASYGPARERVVFVCA